MTNRSPSGVGTGIGVMVLYLLIWLIWSLIYCACAVCWPDDRPSCRGRPDGVWRAAATVWATL